MTRLGNGLVLLLTLSVAPLACGPNSAGGGSGSGGGNAGSGAHTGGSGGIPSGTGGAGVGAGGAGVGMGGAGAGGQMVADPCDERAKLIYLVDTDNSFWSFKPDAMPPLVRIGTLNCPVMEGPPPFPGLPGAKPTPFSMAVDRSATAWVLYSDGTIWKVDTSNAACTATTFQKNQMGFETFGMGFVSNAPGSEMETLYVAGGAHDPLTGAPTGPVRLGTLSTMSLAISPLGNVTGNPELTGTGDAELWGFYPDVTPAKVAKLDKMTGAETMMFPASMISGMPQAWAFAFWGGDFYMFLKKMGDPSTVIYKMNRMTGMVSTFMANTGRTIVGAGVSTCAPIVIG